MDDNRASQYANAAMLYMSGTGNTRRAAIWMQQRAAIQGLDAQAVAINDPGARAVTSTADLLGLLMPTHGFTAPWAMIWFAWRLPRGRARHAFVVATRAGTRIGKVHLPGMEGTAGYLIAAILLLKGYSIRGVLPLDMPSNWLAAHPGMSRASADSIIARAQPHAELFMDRILLRRRQFRGFIGLTLGLLLWHISLAYIAMGRFLLAKLFFADTRCDGCGVCVANCPHRAVRMGPGQRPFWTFSCESCMRCMAYCPKQAVQAGWSLALLLVYSANLVVAGLLTGRVMRAIQSLGYGAGTVRFGISWVVYVTVFALCYLLVTEFIRLKLINRVFAWTTPTVLFRRYHEPGTPLGAFRDQPPQDREIPR